MHDYINRFINDESLQVPVFNFFVLVSRFEFALKKVEGYSGNNRMGIYSPHWRKFKDENESKIIQLKETNQILADALNYYEEKPPEKQIGPQEFQAEDEDSVLMQVYRVRCNLFHGGKYILPEEGVEEHFISRYKSLVENGIIILEEAIKVDEEVGFYFWGMG